MTSYTVVALAVIALLLIGIRPGAWGFLRFILAMHLLGDVLFGWVWPILPTYAFMKYVDDADRIYAAVFLAIAVILTDVAYRLTGRIRLLVASRFGFQRSDVGQRPASPNQGFASAFLIAGLVCKLIFLGATGVLTGAKTLAELQPSDSLGLGAIIMLADFLVPYGVAALRRSGRAPWPVVGDLLLLAAISFLSFSKAGFITYGLIYGLAFLLGEGSQRTRREFLNWKSLLIVVIAFLSLGIKSQQRAGLLVSFGSQAMTEQAVTGASARFMGGVFRAYAVAVREVRHGWPPLGGSYHQSAALLIVPRTLWPDKPHVVAEQLYHLLGVTEEAYGTAFAINLYGCLVFDFGLLGCLVGAALVGVILQFGDMFIPRWRELSRVSLRGGRWHYFATMWVSLAVLLSEGGIPVAIVSAIGLSAAYFAVQFANHAAYAVLLAASGASRRRAARPIPS